MTVVLGMAVSHIKDLYKENKDLKSRLKVQQSFLDQVWAEKGLMKNPVKK